MLKSSESLAQRERVRVPKRRVFRRVAALLALGIVAAACGDDGSSTSQASGPSGSGTGTGTGGATTTTVAAPKAGGTFTYLHAFDPTSLDPALGQINGPHSVHYFAIFDALAIETTKDGSVQFRIVESATSTVAAQADHA